MVGKAWIKTPGKAQQFHGTNSEQQLNRFVSSTTPLTAAAPSLEYLPQSRCGSTPKAGEFPNQILEPKSLFQLDAGSSEMKFCEFRVLDIRGDHHHVDVFVLQQV